MAFKLLIVCALFVVTAKANFAWSNAFAGFQMPQMPQMPHFPQMPMMPQITMPPFPTFTMPPMPKLLTPQEIIELAKSNPNSNSNTIVVASQSSTKTDANGNPIKEGGTAVFSDTNGEVNRASWGNKPPVLDVPSATPTSNSKTPHAKASPEDKPEDLQNDINSVSYVSTGDNGAGAVQSVVSNGGGLQSAFAGTVGGGGFAGAVTSAVSTAGFASSSSSSSSSHKNVNGVTSAEIVASTLSNVNGKVAGQTVHYTV